MPKRNFKVGNLIKNAGEALVDIPHFAILRFSEPQEIVDNFEKDWGTSPKGVVLPVVLPDGLLFPVLGLDSKFSNYASVSAKFKEFGDVVKAFAEKGLDIYLLIDPTMNFIRVGALHIQDIQGNGVPAICIGNPRSQDVIAAALGTAVDIVLETTQKLPGKLKGVVFDAVDLWPMSASNNRIDLTCFCPSCIQFFETYSAGLIKRFRTFPNPWNLALRETSTGINHIDEIRPTTTEEEIVGLSRHRAFVDVFKTDDYIELLENAKVLSQYVVIRHRQTIKAIEDIFDQALEGLENRPRRIILTQGAYYDWTGGLQIERLDDLPGAKDQLPHDEVWFDPSSTDLFLSNVDFRSYMWARGRYFIDAFFQVCSQAADSVARATTSLSRYSSEEVKSLLRRRLDIALGATMGGQSALVALPELKGAQSSKSHRIGIIGVALTREVGEKIIEGIRIVETGDKFSRGIKGKGPQDVSELLGRLFSMQNDEDD